MLKRVVITLRWPMAIGAVLVVGLMLGFRGYGWEFRFDNGAMVARRAVEQPAANREPLIKVRVREIELMKRHDWVWWFERHDLGSHSELWIPLWTVASAGAGLAFAGFVAHRRRPLPGLCTGCRYQLRGASTCPECGRLQPSN